MLQGQNLRTDDSVEGQMVTTRNLGLKDVLSQLKHYNSNSQKGKIY